MKKFLLIVFVIFFSACAKDKKPEPSAELDYVNAMKDLKDKDYISSSEKFEKISDEYPLSKWGAKGKIMSAYGYYKEQRYEDVIRLSENFAQDNPGSKYYSYMQYLKGLSYYDQISDIDRAQDSAILTSYSFRELIAKFPDTQYAKDAKKKLPLVDGHISGAKMSIGRYQMQNGNYVGAIKNFNKVINQYGRTINAPEAYFRLYEVHYKIGLEEVAKGYLQELRKLYPENIWAAQKDISAITGQ